MKKMVYSQEGELLEVEEVVEGQVVVKDADGQVINTRPANPEELVPFELPVTPEARVAAAVTEAVDSAPNSIAGLKNAIKTSLAQFL